MNAIKITEVVANGGSSCAFKGSDHTLGIAHRDASGHWLLHLQTGLELLCEDFDDMRYKILAALPGQSAYFERRRIQPRARVHARRCA